MGVGGRGGEAHIHVHVCVGVMKVFYVKALMQLSCSVALLCNTLVYHISDTQQCVIFSSLFTLDVFMFACMRLAENLIICRPDHWQDLLG